MAEMRIDKRNAPRLIDALRKTADAFDKQPRPLIFGCGMCFALNEFYPYAYSAIPALLLKAHGERDIPGGYPFKQDRALMCLFLAEWLQTEVLDA